jgi:threonine dehydratase
MCRAEIFFKCENFQKAGVFKVRGATNAVMSLSDQEAGRGVATHSSGNHAAAVALAARHRGIRAWVVMPETAPRVKKEAVAGYGADICYCQPTLPAREARLAELVVETGAVVIHPFNDYRIIEGQATAALELLAEVPALEAVMAPVGGGGLISGTALSVSNLSPDTRIIAAEPERADDACRSFREGRIVPMINPDTIADGLLTSLGDKTFSIIRRLVNDVVTVTEEGIIQAMQAVWERMKIVIEPSAAVPLGVLMTRRERIPGRRIGIILSGGNVDPSRLPWLTKPGGK